MAAYRRVDDLTVTCRLTACIPGSAPGPTLGIEYGKPLPFYHVCLFTFREKYIGHASLCVCVSVCLSVRHRIPALLHGPGCSLGEW